jgi:ribonucleotide reductase beta subunit family protein with ferritin-like domain
MLYNINNRTKMTSSIIHDNLHNRDMRLSEPILIEDNTRFTQLPIKFKELQDMYWIAESTFWSAKEIDYGADLSDWETLSEDEKYFIENILAFFAGSDGIVLENLMKNFCYEVKCSEARNFYAFQAMIENVHGMTYSLLLDTLVKDKKRKKQLFEAIDTIPAVAKKAKWAMKWLTNSNPFEERLLAFAFVEGIFFSASFCSIFWLKSRNKMTKALGKSNELISRDESLHCQFAILLYKHLNNKVSQNRVEEIIKEAVEIETEFIVDSIPCRLIGMNSELMSQYIKYVADRLLVQLGFKKLYYTENPFDFMKSFGLDAKTNFFEARVSEYQHSSTAKAVGDDCWDFGDEL